MQLSTISPQNDMNERDVMPTTQPNIYLQSLPAALDLTQLDQQDPDFAYHWLKQLFQDGQLQLQVHPSFPVGEKLQHLYFSARNHERLKGTSIAGFGYPLLLWSQGEEAITAPLFIWQINITPAQNSIGSWVIGHREERVVPNISLLEFLKTQHDVDLAPTLQKAIQNGKITSKALIDCCTAIATRLGVDNNSQNITIEACPEKQILAERISKGVIQWSGIIGAFPTYFPKKTEALLPTLHEIQKEGHDFGLLSLDPHQASALQAIFKNSMVLVKGNSGTGKTHLLVHLLSNALSNGKRCLVVSENVGALRQIYNQLEQLGLLKYSFLLQDEFADKSVLLNLLLTLANTNTPTPAYQESAYRIALDKSKRLKTKLDESYRQLRQDVFGPNNWTETVGLFLRSNRAEGKELLASHLNTIDFKFNYEEFQILQEGIRISQPLYLKINTLRHPLHNLNEAIFVKQTQVDGFNFIDQQTQTFLSKAQKLHHRYITKTNAYADALAERYEGEYGEYANALMRLKDLMADFTTRFGTDFEQAGAGALKLRGVFSGKYKSVLEARDEVAVHYNILVKKFEQQPPFNFQFTPAAEGKNMQKVRQNLTNFEKTLQHWRTSHPAFVQEGIQRLNAKSLQNDATFHTPITELEYGLDQLISELNSVRLYQQPFENKMLTIPKRQKYLEEIIEQLENTRLYLREYEVFYDWQRHWLLVPENAKKIIRALVKVKPNDWLQAFESWYLHHCLNLFGHANFTVEEKTISDFVNSYEQLKKWLPGQIAQHWQKEREELLKTIRRTDREAFNVIFDKKTADVPKDKSLRQIIEPVMDAVSTFFPILLTTPHALATALPQLSEHFDYVLFEEAEYISTENITNNLYLAKQAVFFEDAGQVPMQETSAISAWAKANLIPTCNLPISHRQYPGNVLQSFDNQQLKEEFNIQFEQVDGRFDEIAGTNDEEAQHIIHLLNEVKPTSQRTFPTVGIACFTVQQRDLIASYLLKIRQKWTVGAEKIQQLERNGLGVFHIDELQGQHFDILILSTVYGIKNAKNELTTQVEKLNQQDIVRQLQLLMSRPLQTLFIANSIPESHLKEWLKNPEAAGHFLLAHYLYYNQHSKKVGANGQEEIFQELDNWLTTSHLNESENVFAQEVAIALEPYLGASRVKTDVKRGELHLPLLVEGTEAEQPVLALQPDGFFADSAATDYAWEEAQREALITQAFVYQPIWSAYWWKNPRQEARKLASLIIKMDTDYFNEKMKNEE